MTTIILTSDGSFDNYPDNTPGKFQSDLNRTMHFNFNHDHGWEIALSEIFIHPNCWYQIREPFNTFEFAIGDFDIYDLEYAETLVCEQTYYQHTTKVRNDDSVDQYGNVLVKGGTWYSNQYYKRYPVFETSFAHFDKMNPHNLNFKYHFKYWHTKIKYNYDDIAGENNIYQCTIPAGDYTGDKLLSEIHTECRKAFVLLWGNVQYEGYVVEYDLANSLRNVRLQNSKVFTYTISDAKKITIAFSDDAKLVNPRIRLHPMLAYLMGYARTLNEPAEWITKSTGAAILPLNLSANTLTNLYIFTDCVEPTFFNDMQIPLLRQVPCNEISGNIQHDLFGTLLFKKIVKHNIQTMNIWISESITGSPVLYMMYPTVLVFIIQPRI